MFSFMNTNSVITRLCRRLQTRVELFAYGCVQLQFEDVYAKMLEYYTKERVV